MFVRTPFCAALLVAACSFPLGANTAPVADRFVAVPSVAAPGQAIALELAAHDPDCATACTTGCGLTIRGDLLAWSDNTARTPSPFQNSQPGATASPWSATVTWIAPPAEGTYTVSAQISDSGGMLCGGRKTTLASLAITVSSGQPPVIDSFTASPPSVPVGGTADLAVVAHDLSNRPLTYKFAADAGTISQTSPASPDARWTAPQTAGLVTIRATVSPDSGPSITSQVSVNVRIGSFARALEIPDTRATRLAALPDGRMAVVDGASGTLQMIASNGATTWRAAGLATPVAVAYAGDLYVVERGASRVSVWDTTGRRLRELAIDTVLPNGIAAGPNPGELTITDTGSGRAIVIASSTGQFQRAIGDGALASPAGVAISNGRIAIADAGLGRVAIFDANGTLLQTLGDSTLLVRPQGLAWDAANTRLVVSDSFSGELVVLGEEGTVRGSLAGFGTAAGQLINPIDVALVPGGLLAVTTAGGTISEFQLFNSLAPVAAPANVVATDRTGDDGGSIALTWTLSADDPARVAGYIVQRATGETADYQAIGRADKGVAAWTDTPTADGTCYHYQIVATDGVTQTASAPTGCAMSRNDLPPPPPTVLTATPESPFSIRVMWDAVPAQDLAGYIIEIASNGTARAIRADRSATSAIVDGLTADTTCILTIRSIDTAANASAVLTASVATYPDVPPAAPANVEVTDAATGATADVTWTQPADRVPVATYVLTFTPSTRGWPVVTETTTLPTAHVTGLVNTLSYSLTITAVTSWNRASDPSAPVAAVVTSPARNLAVVDPAGWDGATGMVDAAGIRVAFAIEAGTRDFRFQYRSVNAKLQLVLDGSPAGASLGDTAGEWVDGTVEIEKRLLKVAATHTLELRNASFPDPTAQLAVRRVDFVPLPPRNLKTEEMNTVIDVTWTWQEPRADLVVNLLHSADRTDHKQSEYTPVACGGASLARCRDTFLPNDQKMNYRFSIASPAGWSTDAFEVFGHAKYDDFPPPVTDLRVTPVTATDDPPTLKLEWTPLSAALSKNEAPRAVVLYRVYRVEGNAKTLLLETSGPPAQIPAGAVDLATSSLLVRGVDGQGRESQ
ncbi:MAG: fibronectin type III domain-containing protein [Thermoanaerobaculia bacterium]